MTDSWPRSATTSRHSALQARQAKSDRRNWRRRSELPIDCQLTTSAGNVPIALIDISLGGVGIEPPTAVQIGEILRLRLHLAGWGWCDYGVTVVRIAGLHVGARFRSFSPAQLTALLEALGYPLI